jgi:hypothetical protein
MQRPASTNPPPLAQSPSVTATRRLPPSPCATCSDTPESEIQEVEGEAEWPRRAAAEHDADPMLLPPTSSARMAATGALTVRRCRRAPGVEEKREATSAGSWMHSANRASVDVVGAGVVVLLEVGEGVVEEVEGSGVVDELVASGVAEQVVASGAVEEVEDSGVVEEVEDSGVVEEVEDSGVVEEVEDSGVVEEVEDSGVVEEVVGSGVVEEVVGSGAVTVQEVVVEVVHAIVVEVGEGVVELLEGVVGAIVVEVGEGVVELLEGVVEM